jgi:hypothetical protein
MKRISFFLVEKSCLSWDETRTRYFYRFCYVFLRCFLVIEKQLYLKSSIQIYILLLLCLFRDSSLAHYGHLSSLSFLSLTLSLSLSLSLSLVFAIVVVAKEKNKNRRFARSPVNHSSRQQTLCYASPSSSLNQSPIHLFLSLSLSSPSL